MPIYTMVCPICGDEEDIYCHHSMKELFTCHKCKCKLMEKPTAPGFIINGFKSKKGSDKNYE